MMFQTIQEIDVCSQSIVLLFIKVCLLMLRTGIDLFYFVAVHISRLPQYCHLVTRLDKLLANSG